MEQTVKEAELIDTYRAPEGRFIKKYYHEGVLISLSIFLVGETFMGGTWYFLDDHVIRLGSVERAYGG